MRPLYENDHSIAAENEIRLIIEKKFAMKLVKLPMSYHVDFFATKDGKGVGWIEIKDRPKFDYDTYMISAMKAVYAHQLAAATGLPVSLIVRLNGVLFSYKFFAPEWELGVGGRTDRGDKMDVEPCVFIPLEKFKRLSI